MEVVSLSVSGILTTVILGLGKWYFNQLNARIKNNEAVIEALKDDLSKTKTELELNKQADQNFRENVNNNMNDIKAGQASLMDKFDKFFSTYGFVLEKLKVKELKG